MRATEKRKLHSVPYDIFYYIVEEIDLSDFNNLSKANRTLYNLLQNDLLAKRTIKRHVRYSKEAQLAFAGKISFRQAIGRLHDTRQAVAMAQPYSVAVLSYAKTFIYREGVLSYVTDNEIRVLDVHTAGRKEQVVDVQNVLRRVIPRFCQHEAESRSAAAQLSFLHYSSGILAVLVEVGDPNAWLILLDVTPGGSKQPKGYKPGRLRFVTQLTCTRRLFVRHNSAHLFYGVNSSVDASGELLWAVYWADLTRDNRAAVDTQPTVLDKLAGTELGHNVCFEIFDNHLYAVSNIIDSDEEEEALNWRSFYEWACIPPACGRRRAHARRIWRRDHLEGPINDTWTEMSLRLDEATGQPMILECRREWREGGSDHVRTYYAEPLPRVAELGSTAPDEAEHAPPPTTHSPSFPPNLIRGGAGPSNINFAAPSQLPLNGPTKADLQLHRRPGRHVHSEYSASCSTKRDFILAKTKYRTYNLSACAFIDLVNDPEPNHSFGAATDRVRLRINARKRKYAEDEASPFHVDHCAGGGKRRRQNDPRIEPDAAASDGVRLWPPENADEELIKLLCPSRQATNIHAVADERSLIYSVDTQTQQQAIVLISFDPQIRLPCMRSKSQKEDATAANINSHAPFGISLLDTDNVKSGMRRFSVGPCPNVSSSKSSVRTEPAMHLSIDKGYWFDAER
ncbi:hypothetical protein UA08_01701 [Talaromyces atroroseus]|uniref:F-box domain-containing protein n=1 Tax=Talaromyces atroroseus TaxID=1441469 RepID=A0A1Q5QA76_TALAT|nr:hypothetical protein UA08_01701 [Talaromyces atroroseus]OKL62820.1 hypothetical protein UA08_01701 [Talaromyces atroroseus]